MLNLDSFKIKAVNTDLVLGTSLKHIKPFNALETVFSLSKAVQLLTVEDLPSFLTLYKAYRLSQKVNLRVAPELDLATLTASLNERECVVFGIKDENQNLLVGVVVYFSKLPEHLGEQYFGNDFNRFGFIRMFCYAPGEESLSKTLLQHVLLELKALKLKACVAFVTPQHTKICNAVLPKKHFKRCTGQNFTADSEALFCLELNVEDGK